MAAEQIWFRYWMDFILSLIHFRVHAVCLFLSHYRAYAALQRKENTKKWNKIKDWKSEVRNAALHGIARICVALFFSPTGNNKFHLTKLNSLPHFELVYTYFICILIFVYSIMLSQNNPSQLHFSKQGRRRVRYYAEHLFLFLRVGWYQKIERFTQREANQFEISIFYTPYFDFH